MTIQLRDYQVEATNGVLSHIKKWERRLLIVLATGLGKTTVFSNLAGIVKKASWKQTLILAHRDELLTQAKDRVELMNPGILVGVEWGANMATGKEDVIVASVQTLGRSTSERIKKFDPKNFGLIVIDECFIAGTKVSGKNIEDIRVWDIVDSFNEKTMKIVKKRVTRLFKNKIQQLVEVKLADSRIIVCTPWHPFLTQDWWKEAYLLSNIDKVYSFHYNDNITIKYDSNLLTLQERTRSNIKMEKRNGEEMKSLLLRWMQERVSENYIIRNNEQDEQNICKQENENKEPYENSWSKRKNEEEFIRKKIQGKGMKRKNNKTTTSFVWKIKMKRVWAWSSGTNKENSREYSTQLQNWYSQQREKDSYRNWWEKPQIDSADRKGQEKRESISIIGVEGVTFLEWRNWQWLNEMYGDGCVYNIEVEDTHTYIANGIIVHNCHHSTSDTYRNILEYFGSKTDTHPVILGVTATPNRADWEDLKEIFDHVVCNYDIKYGIQNGYLSNIKAYTVNTETDISEVGMTAWDFKIGELGEAVNTEARNELIIETYKKLLKGKKAIAFCVNVEHSKTLAEAFREKKISAESVTGDTPKEERDKIMDDYKNGKLQILCNCLVATEGFDAPTTEGILLARPTKSESLFIQMAGRWLRISEGKEHVKLIDFVDNTKNNSIVSSSCFIGMKKPVKMNWENIFDYEEKFKQLVASNPFLDISSIDLDKLDEKIKEVDIFGIMNISEDVKKCSKNRWQPYGTWYKISLWKHIVEKSIPGTDYKSEIEVGTAISIQEDTLWNYKIEVSELTPQTPHFKNGFQRYAKKVIHTEEAPMKEVALMRADEIINTRYADRKNIVSQDARWLKDKPTPKQIELLKKFGFQDTDKVSKGQACNLLDYYFSQKGRKRK